MRMTRFLAILFVLLSIYSVMSGCPSCGISQVKSWTLSVNNGVGTARCCPKSEASAGVSLLWPNATDIKPANYSYSSSNGCDEISIALTDQHCAGVQVVCETSWGRSALKKENASIELKFCSSLYAGSDSIDLLQVCLNCSDVHNREATSTDTLIIEATSTDTLIIIGTSSLGSDTILSTAATPVVVDLISNTHLQVVAPVVAILLLVIVFAILSTVSIIRLKNRRKKYVMGHVQENTGLLDNSIKVLRSPSDTSAIPSSTEAAVNSNGPVQPFAPPGHEPPNLNSSCPDLIDNSYSSPPEQECSLQPDGEMASVFVVQASDRLFLPRSLSKDTDDVRYISENDTRKMNLSRSLSCPNS